MLGISSSIFIPGRKQVGTKNIQNMYYTQETINAQVYSNLILKLIVPVPNTAVEVEGRSTGEL